MSQDYLARLMLIGGIGGILCAGLAAYILKKSGKKMEGSWGWLLAIITTFAFSCIFLLTGVIVLVWPQVF